MAKVALFLRIVNVVHFMLRVELTCNAAKSISPFFSS